MHVSIRAQRLRLSPCYAGSGLHKLYACVRAMHAIPSMGSYCHRLTHLVASVRSLLLPILWQRLPLLTGTMHLLADTQLCLALYTGKHTVWSHRTKGCCRLHCHIECRRGSLRLQ